MAFLFYALVMALAFIGLTAICESIDLWLYKRRLQKKLDAWNKAQCDCDECDGRCILNKPKGKK